MIGLGLGLRFTIVLFASYTAARAPRELGEAGDHTSTEI